MMIDGVKRKLEEIEAFRQKLKEKDMYIQNQATKLIRIQAVSEKYSHEIANLKKINTVSFHCLILIIMI